MPEITHEQVASNGITLHVASCGPLDGPPVVLCHGFPELWYSWRHQLVALGDAGYRALAPDLRGYGASSRPQGDIAQYGSDQLTLDLCGLLDHFGYERAAFVGHDWGAIVVWEMGKLHPDRVSSIFNMSVPLMQAPAPPVGIYDSIFADRFFYIIYFQPVGVAEKELEADPRRYVRTMLYSVSGEGMSEAPLPLAPREGTLMLDTLHAAPEQLPPWITEDDVDVYAKAFAEGGFFGPLSYYRNLDANWERGKDIVTSTIAMPTGFLTGSLDPVRLMMPGAAEAMPSALPDFRGTTTIEGAGHWVQQERPEETNAALLAFLSSVG
jgi:pimeloyl-ACP methyl ester carboxylesterase